MRRFSIFATSMMLALAMLMAPDMMGQSRSSGGSSTTRSSGSTSTSRSSGSSSSSSSSRSSGSAVTRSSGSSSSSGSSVSRSQSSSTTRSSSSSAVQQQDNRRSSGSTSTSRSSGSTSTSRSSGSTVTRSSGSSSSSSSAARQQQSGTTVRSSQSSQGSTGSGSAVSSSSTARSSSSQSTKNVTASGSSSTSSGQQARSSSSQQQQAVTGTTVRSSNVSRNGLTSGASQAESAPVKATYRDDGYNYRYQDDMRVDDRHNMYRVPPRQRDPMAWDKPGYFWGDHPHYYGYRIHSLPPSWRRVSHWGIDYYYYNGIFYRPYGGAYVVCRPPFGTPLEAAIDRAIFRAVRFAYYCDTYRTYSQTFDYYNVIARQNLIIAQQNARLIAQNNALAINANRALTAYELAEKLGLVQSYAYANSEYFYQDGVFYTISASGIYSTIVPPAGALVTSLPDDYEIIVMNGIEYYMVDNTVYRTTLFEGVPYLEVLGQMYGSLYSQYNIYR